MNYLVNYLFEKRVYNNLKIYIFYTTFRDNSQVPRGSRTSLRKWVCMYSARKNLIFFFRLPLITQLYQFCNIAPRLPRVGKQPNSRQHLKRRKMPPGKGVSGRSDGLCADGDDYGAARVDMCLQIKWFPPMRIFKRARGRTRHIKQTCLQMIKRA